MSCNKQINLCASVSVHQNRDSDVVCKYDYCLEFNG